MIKSYSIFTKDHPRACGEHGMLAQSVLAWAGSSPRLRGALAVLGYSSIDDGIIPALAGSTPSLSGRPRILRDHPRACGEHLVSGKDVVFRWGSSPRLRGARACHRHRALVRGIIPALAGSTTHNRARTHAPWDHPRACGEHDHHQQAQGRRTGSSPRLRGAPPLHMPNWSLPGIIPALAGSTRHHSH